MCVPTNFFLIKCVPNNFFLRKCGKKLLVYSISNSPHLLGLSLGKNVEKNMGK